MCYDSLSHFTADFGAVARQRIAPWQTWSDRFYFLVEYFVVTSHGYLHYCLDNTVYKTQSERKKNSIKRLEKGRSITLVIEINLLSQTDTYHSYQYIQETTARHNFRKTKS